MIAVLLSGLLLVLGALGFGAYLLFRPDPPQTQPPPAPADSRPPDGTAGAPPESTGTPAPGTGAGSSTVDGPEPGGTGDLQTTARDYVDAVNDQDSAAATALTCERADPGTLYSVAEGREVTLGTVEVLEGSVGSAQVTVGDGETALLLEKREDNWCVAI
jgi:hypothetical protein